MKQNLAGIITCVAILLFVLRPGSAVAETPLEIPSWIWSNSAASPNTNDETEYRFERRFSAGLVSAATLRMAADFCQTAVEINGQRALCLAPFSPTIQIDVTPLLRRGENRLAIIADHPCGPSAVALSLLLQGADGKRTSILTDSHWQASRGKQPIPVTILGTVAAQLWGLGRPDATIDPFQNYEQWRIASTAPGSASGIVAAPGFQTTLLRQAQDDEGSWISMAFDPQGRLTVSREDQGLLRMTFGGDGVQKVEIINEDLKECRGLLYAHGALYANANNSQGLYRLRDTKGDGKLDDVRLLREFPGRAGHGRNDLALGADGLIYSMHGDSVELPLKGVLDRTSPFREARRGKTTSEGYLIRTDREGQQWEIVAAGLRNPYGIGVHPNGDLFTYDADAEFDMGTPWYRPTRIDQLRSGADFGWRGVTGQWPPYFSDHPDNALPTLDIGRGSPTAVAFGTNSSFPPPYHEALFVLDWAYGRMLAVHFAPRGAGYRAAAETFLQGRPLNLTDLAFGPDGALYAITGGRRTQSALYRIAYTGSPVAVPATSEHERACSEHALAAKKLRERLETFHGHVDPAAVETAWPHVDSADPALRYAAQLAIEHQPLAAWRERALADARPTASLSLLVSLLRSGEPSLLPPLANRLAKFDLQQLEAQQQQSFLFACQLIADQDAAVLAPCSEPIRGLLLAMTSNISPAGQGNLRHRAALLLARIDETRSSEPIGKTLLMTNTQEDRLLGLLALRQVQAGWTPAGRREYFAALHEMPRFVAGEGMPKFLAHLRKDSESTLSEAERTSLADVLQPPEESGNEEPWPTRPLVKKWQMSDFTNRLDNSSRSGDAGRGAGVFRDAQCVRCHRVGARGPAVGPDLSFVARRFSRRDMLESILLPSQVVAEHYRNVQLSTKDGRTLLGRVLIEGDFRSETLRIAYDPQRPAAIAEVQKQDIDEYRLSDISPMPTGLLDGFQQSEILDLLAYLESGPTMSGVPQ